MRKFGICLLMLGFVLCPLAVDALGENLNFQMPSTITQGEVFSITVGTSGLTSTNVVKGYRVELDYPADQLTLNGCSTLLSDYTSSSLSTDGHIIEMAYTTEEGKFLSSNQNILKCEFKATGNAGSALNVKLLSTSYLTGKDDSQLSATASTKDLTITSLSNDASLKALKIDNIPFTFNSSTLEYHLTATQDISKIVISGTANNDKAIVSGLGEKTLTSGENKFSIEVKAEDGTKQIYTLIITKDRVLLKDTTLKSLYIKGVTFNEKFDKDTKVYTGTVPYETTKVYIQAETSDKNAKILVTGATTLTAGKANIIYVTVMAENGTKEDYLIKLTRRSKDGSEAPDKDNDKEERPKDDTSTTEPDDSKKDEDKGKEEVTPPTKTEEEEKDTTKQIVLIISCVVVAGLVVGGVYFYLRKDTPRKQ